MAPNNGALAQDQYVQTNGFVDTAYNELNNNKPTLYKKALKTKLKNRNNQRRKIKR